MKRISYEWTFDEWEGKSVSQFDIEEDESGNVELKMTVSVLEDFDNSIPEFQRNSCIGGWNYFLGQELKNYLES